MMRGLPRARSTRMLDGLSPRRVLEVGVGEGEVIDAPARAVPRRPVDRARPARRRVGEQLAPRRHVLACSVTAPRSRSPTMRSIWCSPSRCSNTSRAPTPRWPSCRRRVLRHADRLGAARADLAGRESRSGGAMCASSATPRATSTTGRGRGFSRFVGRRFDIEQVKSPLPWTMVRAQVNA